MSNPSVAAPSNVFVFDIAINEFSFAIAKSTPDPPRFGDQSVVNKQPFIDKTVYQAI